VGEEGGRDRPAAQSIALNPQRPRGSLGSAVRRIAARYVFAAKSRGNC
jgi:hypothetical protein